MFKQQKWEASNLNKKTVNLDHTRYNSLVSVFSTLETHCYTFACSHVLHFEPEETILEG